MKVMLAKSSSKTFIRANFKYDWKERPRYSISMGYFDFVKAMSVNKECKNITQIKSTFVNTIYWNNRFSVHVMYDLIDGKYKLCEVNRCGNLFHELVHWYHFVGLGLYIERDSTKSAFNFSRALYKLSQYLWNHDTLSCVAYRDGGFIAPPIENKLTLESILYYSKYSKATKATKATLACLDTFYETIEEQRTVFGFEYFNVYDPLNENAFYVFTKGRLKPVYADFTIPAFSGNWITIAAGDTEGHISAMRGVWAFCFSKIQPRFMARYSTLVAQDSRAGRGFSDFFNSLRSPILPPLPVSGDSPSPSVTKPADSSKLSESSDSSSSSSSVKK
jgi:hypothetical protein